MNTPARRAYRILTGNDYCEPIKPKETGYASIIGIIFVIIGLIFAVMMVGKAHAYTPEEYCEAIHKAEGNDNYGVLATYKHTSKRQACINTVRHTERRWIKARQPGTFLHYLASVYAPIGAKNDPNGLNRNWERNVKFYLNKKRGG